MARKTVAVAHRAPWGSISREQIVTAATRLIRASGYENLTIRRLAAELGVAPMSIYRHVRDKDDLLEEVVDRLLARVWRPRLSEDDWRIWVTEAHNKLRQFLVAQPAALHVFLAHPVVTPNAVARMEAVVRVLTRGLGDETGARRGYAALHTYTIGFAALEAARAGWDATDQSVGELARQLASFTTAGQFAEGLSFLLAGIERDVKPGGPENHPPAPGKPG
jgi:AcrR family transcriptional regulator